MKKLLPNARGFGAMKFAGKKYKLMDADYGNGVLTARVFDASGGLTLANAPYRVYMFRYVSDVGYAATTATAGTPANAWAVLPRFG